MRRKKAIHHPYFRRGSPEFERALKLATPAEAMIWKRFGIAQFTPDDPRLKKIVKASASLTDRSHAMTGDRG